MAKNRNDYFSLIEEQLSHSVRASELLREILSNVTSENIQAYKERMHEIEHLGDDIHHSILSRLSAEFITPIDQEDILHLVQLIDDITDALDEVVLELYMFDVRRVPDTAPMLGEKVDECVKALYAAGAELRNFKKPEQLRRHLIEVNARESEADEIYTEAIHKLFVTESDVRILLGSKSIYDSLEGCCDLCEHASDIIEQIVIKNT